MIQTYGRSKERTLQAIDSRSLRHGLLGIANNFYLLTSYSIMTFSVKVFGLPLAKYVN